MSIPKHSIPPSLAWLTVFVPALAYLLGSRLSDTRLSGKSLGTFVPSNPQFSVPSEAKQVLFLDSTNTALHQNLHSVQTKGLEDIVDIMWKHDEELGRGYLLLSQSANAGRIWRWEVGGGPIAIGKTLHMEPSGCRSHSDCNGTSHGSGGIALDFSSHGSSFEGRLVVSEWGEGRIVRMEASGARTPLVLHVPSLCRDNGTVRRIHQPNALLYTTYGDLLVADYDAECHQAALYYVDNAMTIPPLESALESRKAHKWTALENHQRAIRIFYTLENLKAIGGLALDATWEGLYAMVQVMKEEEGKVQVQLMHLFLSDGDEEPLWNGRSNVVYEWPSTEPPGPIVVDQQGYLYVGVNQTLVILRNDRPISTLDLPARATSLALGQDGYLYISSASELLRIKVRNQPLKVPTNLVVKKKV